MKIKFNGKTISNIKDWEKEVFSGKKKIHWKVGRSAYSLADFIINKNGKVDIKKEIIKVIGVDLTFNIAHPEYEVQFDKFGHGREHDLGIFGVTKSGKKVFIGIEAKVDEPFGDTIAESYIKGKIKELNGKNTNAPKRIEKLLKSNFGIIKNSHFKLPYQLLFSTAGTLSVDADIHIFFVIVFKTYLSNALKVTQNKNKYIKFHEELGAVKMPNNCYKTIINGRELYSIYMTK